MEILNSLVQVFVGFGAVLLASEMRKRQKRNDDQLKPAPIHVEEKRRNRRK